MSYVIALMFPAFVVVVLLIFVAMVGDAAERIARAFLSALKQFVLGDE